MSHVWYCCYSIRFVFVLALANWSSIYIGLHKFFFVIKDNLLSWIYEDNFEVHVQYEGKDTYIWWEQYLENFGYPCVPFNSTLKHEKLVWSSFKMTTLWLHFHTSHKHKNGMWRRRNGIDLQKNKNVGRVMEKIFSSCMVSEVDDVVNLNANNPIDVKVKVAV